MPGGFDSRPSHDVEGAARVAMTAARNGARMGTGETDMVKIMGRYRGGRAEEIDSADTRREAERLLGEYRLAFGSDWVLWLEVK